MHNSHKVRQTSALIFVLKALIPYSQQNMMLAFKTNRFFNELEDVSAYKRRTLERALYNAQKQNLVEQTANIVRLTDSGQKLLRPFIAQHLPNTGQLMIIFDIPEQMATARAHLRRILRSWHFKQVQKSVWVTSYDHRQSLQELVVELGIKEHVQLYECAQI